MTDYDRFEYKCASTLIGPTGVSRFWSVLSAQGMAQTWGVLIIFIGVILIYGSLRPHRKLRHMGLVLSSFLWAAMFSLFAVDNLWTPVAMLMPVFAFVSVLLLFQDTKCGSRNVSRK
jgi:multisubunit Na+/H+ antiporter MnhG subunit